MDFRKFTSVIKIILLKIVDEIERRINERNGIESTDSFTGSLYTSIKFIILEQVDGMVDEVVSYTKTQVNSLATLVAEKVAVILASMVYVMILVFLIFMTYIFFAVSLSLYLGQLLGGYHFGFLIVGGINILMVVLFSIWGQSSISNKIKGFLTKLL